jgi:hypothetical protein
MYSTYRCSACSLTPNHETALNFGARTVKTSARRTSAALVPYAAHTAPTLTSKQMLICATENAVSEVLQFVHPRRVPPVWNRE